MNAFSVDDFNAGLNLARPEIFLGLAACGILLLDLLLSGQPLAQPHQQVGLLAFDMQSRDEKSGIPHEPWIDDRDIANDDAFLS